jgi:ssDNA-binding Zn-finger/Zn-ribbon topoisomerase 1
MAKKKPEGPAPTCPQCGTVMVRESVADLDVLKKQQSEVGVQPQAAARFREQLAQKNEELGPIYRCPADRYLMRVKDGDGREAA